MKTIFVLLALSSAVFSRSFPTLNQTLESCAAEVGIGENLLETFEILEELEDVDHAAKCVTKCRMQKVKTSNEEGIFDPQRMIDNLVTVLECKSVDEDIINEALAILSRCNNGHIIGDPCEKAFWAYKCVLTNFKPEVETRVLNMC